MQSTREYLQIFSLTALTYFAVARLALLLAIPPGYATAVWPSAGIALAVLYLCGYRYWPAVVLGSFLSNAYGELVWSEGGAVWLQSASLPVIIGLGAAGQALLGAYLMRRWLGAAPRLDTTSGVLVFLLVICGLGSMLSATVGAGALWQQGKLEWENLPYNWFTWWVGDGLGVMLLTPLIFVWRAQPRGIWRSRARVLPPVLLLASVIVVLAYVYTSRWEYARQEEAFERQAVQLFQHSNTVLQGYLDSVYAARAFIAASDEVSAADFRAFAATILARNPGFQGVAWNQVVGDAERDLLEGQMSRELAERVLFAEVDRNGTRMRAERRDNYVVVRYIEPLQGNRRALAYDISSNPVARHALLRASSSRGASVAAPITLIQENGSQKGAVVYLPLFRGEQLRGYASGVFRLGDLMAAILAGERLTGISLRLLSGEGENARLLYAADREVGRRQGGELFRRAWSFSFADQVWRLEFGGDQRFLVDSRSSMPWWGLAAGLLFVGLLGMSLLVLTGAKYRSEAAGRELAAMVDRLRDTQGQLVEAEKLAALGGMVAGFAHELNTPIGIAITAQSTFAADLRRLEAFVESGGADARHRADILKRLSEAATMVLDNLQRAGDLIGRLKQVSVDQGSEEWRSINLHDYLCDIAEHLSPGFVRSGHELVLECPRDIYITTVPSTLTQVLVNVVSNALHHAFADGQAGRVRICVAREGDMVNVDICDDGRGMNESVRERVFEPFFTTRRGANAASAGLGLYLAYTLVSRQLGGTVKLHSVPDQGSCFQLRLPHSRDGLGALGRP